MNKLTLGIASVAVVSASFVGASRADPPAPRPPSQVDTLFQSAEGKWTCDTTFVAGALGPRAPETKLKATIDIKKDLGGFWYSGEWQMEKTKITPATLVKFAVGYDPLARTAVLVRYDSGGTAALETAPGATPDKQVFVGDAHLAGTTKAKVRETVTRKSPADLEHMFEVDTGRGFQVTSTDVCKK